MKKKHEKATENRTMKQNFNCLIVRNTLKEILQKFRKGEREGQEMHKNREHRNG